MGGDNSEKKILLKKARLYIKMEFFFVNLQKSYTQLSYAFLCMQQNMELQFARHLN